MDIIISSNLERLVYSLSGAQKTKALFESLSQTGKYGFDKKADGFEAEFATDEEAAASIKDVFEKCGYVMDTHTSVAYTSYKKYASKSGDAHKNVTLSTASPFKFPDSVLAAIDKKYKSMDTYKLLEELSDISGLKIPKPLESIKDMPDNFNRDIEKEEMKKEIENLFCKS
jgi:threonine synthase